MEERIRRLLEQESGITVKKMFGGLCFMHRGNMFCGIDNKKNLMVRVGPEQYEKALKLKYAREMDFTGRPMKSMIYVDPEGYEHEEDLKSWVARAAKVGTSLPAE